jgi:peptidoglycan/LPS O-acetylase OafA/YrhL
MTQGSISYKPHIDGLRGVAVSGVLLFHFGATWLPGGFVGVDVFFVISGFLISKSLYGEVARGTFNLAGFYERRVRRIAPAFLATTAGTWVLGFFILFPNELKNLSASVIYGSLFAANIYFYATAGYFSASAHELPLLHLWSLGVEEQFYILFPLVVLFSHALGKRSLPFVILALFVISLLVGHAMLRRDPSAAFYLLPFRAFELLIGAMLALPGVVTTARRAVAGAAVLFGLGLILGSMLLLSDASRFPGAKALYPCVGAALVIWGGECAPSFPSLILGKAVPRFIGRISFSLYLVHWPLAVFVRMRFPDLHPALFLIGGVAASLLIAWLSWRYVEQPFRRRDPPFLSRTSIFATTAVATSCLVATAVFVRAANGFPERMKAEINEVLAFRNFAYQATFREGVCFLRPEQPWTELAPECLPAGTPTIVLWGSSHIAQFYGGLVGPATEKGYRLGQITGSACLPLMNWDHPGRPNCRALNDFALDWLVTNRPTMVVMGGDPIEDPGLLERLDASIERLASAGIKPVLLGPAPYYRRAVPAIIAEKLQREDRTERSQSEFDPISRNADIVMSARYGGRSDVRYISFLDRLCPQAGCEIAEGNVPFHFDTVHFTALGSTYYGRRLANVLFTSSP